MGFMDRLLRTGEGKKVRALADLVPDIGALEPEMQALSDEDLQHRTVEFREQLDRGIPLDDLLIPAFAVVREAASRIIGQRHYDVQLMGGAALHFGWVAEMKTGEGKTLVSTLPVYLNGLPGTGVHVITVNDYLARRDAEWMGQVHRFLGLTIGMILPGEQDPNFKREQYACDITYGTNNEFGFDYLRDNMALSLEEKVQRGHVYAIVDEVDSILIDEARTPLIISGRVGDAAKLYYKFASVARGLTRDVDYEVDEEKRVVFPLPDGIAKVEKSLGVENLYDDVSNSLVHQLQVSIKAKELYKRDRDYLVQNGEVKIVDEFTGRVLEGRRWSEGLHQAVEAKEGVKIKEENQTLATVTLQNYFRMYDKLAGMTGTALTEAAEFMSTYNLQVVPIPTHRPVQRRDDADLIYRSEAAKFSAVVDDIVERQAEGQPVLVGTVSVEKSERLSRELEKRGVPHSVLNAKQHTKEAEVVTQAGRIGSVTVATNMAGRGVDILLGGNPEGLARREVHAEGLEDGTEEAEARYEELLAKYEVECKAEGEEVRKLGGLYVLGTERHESRRIDNQLRGRSGRQGDPGASRFYLSLEDDLMRFFATGAIEWVMGKGWDDDVPIEAKMVTRAIEKAQNTVEARNGEIRKNVLKYDEVMNEQRKVIYARRDEVLEGVDLREETLQALAEATNELIGTHCGSDYSDDWDIEALLGDTATYWPVELTVEDLTEAASQDGLYDLLMADAVSHYEGREAEFGADTFRQIERQIMLRIIDAKWRDHLKEMDYLQEGINLRALGQKDPLTEWQREGFDMFGSLMEAVSKEYVQYVMHVQAVKEEQPRLQPQRFDYSAPDDPSSGPNPVPAVVAAESAHEAAAVQADDDAAPQQPVVKSEWDKTPRNAPCPCGSGKKFKVCHGAA
ncbi:MAG TPA: preprotein translocase subunit SecA [Microthrixaceae bacterium]|nr:preprotein translocase subunit SecA [Microthrixaceae bacterium]RUP35886.1 MAG: preprotein translocase subunit SecA [Gordonia sp. (in: high G+C Gram-positive bacteria)]MCB9400564.1 preprotein translocase subunit SecA [Microthrixaceae bacterium]MCO5306120.1 preprotein translocase subunit SecA [Microthrixaceae bacterium]HMV73906.1 preprotein translocase subunit SecA [Microthrixaceae bacterium]